MTTRDEVLAFIRIYHAEHGYGPSHKEIAAAVGLASTSTVSHHLHRLRDEGLVTWTEGLQRTLRPVPLTFLPGEVLVVRETGIFGTIYHKEGKKP